MTDWFYSLAENDADVMDDDESADGEDVRNQGNNPDGGVPDREMPLASPGFGKFSCMSFGCIYLINIRFLQVV